MSSNYPLNYNTDEICIYTVIAPEGKQLLLTLNSFRLANRDILYVFDDEIALGFPQLKLRGRADETSSSVSSDFQSSSVSANLDFSSIFDEPFRSTGQALVLVFLSDEIKTDEGFHVTLSVIEGMDLILKFEEKCFEKHNYG